MKKDDTKRMEADGIPDMIPVGMTEDAPSLTLEDMKNNLSTPLTAKRYLNADLPEVRPITVKGFMARPGESIFDRGRFPSSRDWSMPDVKCGRRLCTANYSGKCTMPSLIEMDAKGKCKGYHKRASGKKK